jgi:hypothetical protein
MEMDQQLAAAVVTEVRRRLLAEAVPRLHRCLAMLTEAEIWFRPNAETVSIGNLVLHLCGNARQWILSGLGGLPDQRRILIHVTEHFSYHVGQITYAVKSRKAVDMGYYAGVDLTRPSSSPESPE